MRERPILFSGEMVRAILAGAKTQTRRIVKGDADEWLGANMSPSFVAAPSNGLCPYGYVGDRLWVKETFSARGVFEQSGRIAYRASCENGREPHGLPWTPSIFMKRAASRITLELTAVRVERLNDITEMDAEAEGVEKNEGLNPWTPEDGWLKYPLDENLEDFPAFTAKESYRTLWESINGAGSWASNPWVWVLSFRRLT